MKKLAIALLLGGLSCAAMATWVRASDDSDVVRYYDAATLARNGTVVTVAELSDFKRGATASNDRIFLSATGQRQYDCAAARVRTVSLTRFEGPMGTGRAVDGTTVSGEWEAVVPGTARADVLKVVCSK